jgi:hypothetical protein
MTGWKKRLGAVAVGAAVLGSGIGLGATVFAPGSAGAAGSPAAPAPAAGTAERPGPLFGVVHGDLDLTRYDHSTLALVYDRGLIVARDGDTLTVARLDGRRVTIQLTSATVVRVGLRLGSTGDLVVGDRAMFLSRPNADGTFTAVGVRCISGPQA